MFGRGFNLPQGRWQRIALGVALVLGGIVGFLPILGFWMIPLGLFVLSGTFFRATAAPQAHCSLFKTPSKNRLNPVCTVTILVYENGKP